MSSKLDNLLYSIDPQKTYQKTLNKANEAINTFPIRKVQVESWEEFTDYMARFYSHVQAILLGLVAPLNQPSDYFWPFCSQVLRKIYGPSGEKAACHISMTGCEGGLCDVMRKVAIKMGEQCTANETAARINEHLEQLSSAEEFDAVKEYLDKYGHLLPREVTEGGAPRIYAYFADVLKQHVRLLQKTRGMDRESPDTRYF